MNKIASALLLLLIFTVSSVATKQRTPEGDELLRQLEADFAADVAQHGHEAFITHFAEDGVEVVDGGGFDTKDAIRKQPPWPEGTTLTWTPIKAEMAASGDLGYTYGNYVYIAKNKEGKLVTSYGKYTSIWKKQKDGQWKVMVDMGTQVPIRNQRNDAAWAQCNAQLFNQAAAFARIAVIRLVVVGTSIPYRSPPRTIGPPMASNSSCLPAATSFCIELRMAGGTLSKTA
jgi:ketosteroid isomerase-like protein